MADRFWVGGSGNWNATSTANWSASSGGASGASAPTSADNVIFDAASNGAGTGAFTVTVTGTSAAPARCLSFTTGGVGGALDGAMTLSMGATAQLDVYGSITLPATNLTWTGTAGAIVGLQATTTGHTITTNGVSITNTSLRTLGNNGGWTLGSAYTGQELGIQLGTFNTGNYNLTLNNIYSNGVVARTLTLGSSSISVGGGAAPINFSGSNFTFNANTSTITCTNASPTFTGGGQTFYNVTFSSAASGTATINDVNTFNNLTFTSVSSTGIRFIVFGANQTINGALTFGAANTAIRRMGVRTGPSGIRRTLTLNGSLATLADVDFSGIGAAGTVATPWTGTRLGDAKDNNNITFDAPKTVYWNLAGSQNWSATGWATTNTGVPAVNNFPLPQDTATFTEAGAAGTVTIDAGWWIGSIQMADGVSNRTTAFTLATASQTPFIFGNVTFFSNLVLTGGSTINFYGVGSTQAITSSGVSWPQPLVVNSPTGIVRLVDNLTNTNVSIAFTVTQGTLDLNNKTLTCVLFASNNGNTRSIAFGTGNITVTGNGAVVFNMAGVTGFTRTGTPTVNLSYAGSTGTRTINFTTGGTEANSLNFNITAGTDTIALPFIKRSVDFTGFSGTFPPGVSGTTIFYGNLKLSTGMTVSAGGAAFLFQATSGTQTITSNGKTIDTPITVNAPGATVKFADAFTQGSARNFTFTAGTLEFAASATSTVGNFLTTGTTPKTLKSTTNGVQATLSQASGTVNATYTTIQDINATGGATWNAFYVNNNVDAGNNTGWNFTDNPINVSEVTMRLRSFTEPRSF